MAYKNRLLRSRMRIYFSLLLGLVLMIMPWPQMGLYFKPQWIALILIYWVFMRPDSMGVVTAWSAGLGMDILHQGLLGQYALSMAMIAYFAQFLRYRFRLFPFWKQLLVIVMLVSIGQVTLFIVQWLLGNPPRSLVNGLSILSTALCWPIVQRLLQFYGRTWASI